MSFTKNNVVKRVLASLLVILFTFQAHATTTLTSREYVELEDAMMETAAIPMKHKGQEGVWVSLDMMSEVMADVEELRLLREQITLLNGRLELREERIIQLERSLELSLISEERALKAWKLSAENRVQLEENLNKWYRHPLLWLSLGVVLTVALEVTAIKVIEVTN